MNALEELNARLGIGPSRLRLPITLQRSGYTAVRQLGKGSFGNAYLVYNAERKEHYVVKHVNMAAMTPRQRKDAHQEIALLQQLEYPNIVRYVEFFEEFPHLYIVMEYADGGDVYTHLKNLKRSVCALGGGCGGTGGLTEEQVISLFVQTTMAVKYMHDRRLLHRDIKSQNVFLTQGNVVKLGDFGISTVLISTVAMAKTMCGTPCYFSPELCEGKPYNNKSDVWALGVFLYELCTTGRLPFEAVTMNRLMDEICKKEPRRIPANFSDELWSLVRWMLSKEPRERPDAGQILRSPVLVRAIPGLIKKLSATDKRCEKEYGRLLSVDPIPLPPIRLVELQQKHQDHQQQQQQQQRGVGGREEHNNKLLLSQRADAVISAAGAGRFDIFRKLNNEYPFRRINDADPFKKRLGDIYGILEQRHKQSKNIEDGNAPSSNAVLTNKPPLHGDHIKHDPISLQGKVNREGSNTNNNSGKGNSKNCEKNVDANGVNYPSEGLCNRYLNKGKLSEQPAEAKVGRLPLSPPSPPLRPSQLSAVSQKKSFGKIPLKELFLIYDEKKKRIESDRDKRLKQAGGQINCPSDGRDLFREKPAAVEKRPEVRAPQKGFSPLDPCRIIDKNSAIGVVEDAATKVSSDVNAQPAETGDDKFCEAEQRFCETSKYEGNEDNMDLNGKNGGASEVSEPPSDLALVLREMTIHIESVHGGVLRTLDPGECGAASGTSSQPNLVSAASFLSTGSSFVGESREDKNDIGQEFADTMGTTLDVKKLQQKTATPGFIADVGRAEDGESIPMLLVRNDALCVPCANPQLSVQVGGFKEAIMGPGKGKIIQASADAKPPESLSILCTSRMNIDANTGQLVASEEEVGPVFECICLCEGIRFGGLASSIFGSFVCNCMVCTKLSGAIVGLEWLHLPDVQFEDIFADTLPALSSPPAQTQKAGQKEKTSAGGRYEGDAQDQKELLGKSGGAVQLSPLLSKFVLHVPLVEEDGTQLTATYTVYFCSRCGTTLGMDHNDISGTLVAKAALSDISLAILESFQQTMLQSGTEMLSFKQ